MFQVHLWKKYFKQKILHGHLIARFAIIQKMWEMKCSQNKYIDTISIPILLRVNNSVVTRNIFCIFEYFEIKSITFLYIFEKKKLDDLIFEDKSSDRFLILKQSISNKFAYLSS